MAEIYCGKCGAYIGIRMKNPYTGEMRDDTKDGCPRCGKKKRGIY